MEAEILGFKVYCGISPTSKLKIRYVNILRRLGYLRCRLFHDARWIPETFKDKPWFSGPKDTTYRWYYCKQCRMTWLQPMMGQGVCDPSPGVT